MRCLLTVVFTVVLVTAEGKVAPASNVDVQQTDAQFSVSDYIRQAQSNIQKLGTQIQEQFNLPNQEELLNTVKESSNSLTNTFNEYFTNMTEKFNNSEVENLWTNFKNKISETFNKLNISSETTEQINQLPTQFQQSIQTFLVEAGNTATTAKNSSDKVQEDIAKFTKHMINIVMEASQNLTNQLQQSTTQQVTTSESHS